MDLAIELECSGCGCVTLQRVADIAPNRDRRCRDCGADLPLTEKALGRLEEALRILVEG